MIVEWYAMAVCSPRESAVYWIVREHYRGMFAVELADFGRGYWYVFGYEDPIEAEELRYWAHVAWPALPPAMVVQEARIDEERGRENRHG